MGVFSEMGKTSPTQGGNYLVPGNYLLEIQRVKMQGSQTGNKKFFIAELKVIEAEQTESKIEPNGVNTEPSWLVEVPGKFKELSLGNIKAFLMAAYGALVVQEGEDPPEADDIGEEEANEAVSEHNPLAGVRVTAKAFHKETQKGGVFTRVKWGIPDLDEN